ncbi:MAG: hypothetical protein H6744_09020 [Deltaproteobacteria bacterium]|nr:hypothetical protein [Deltaproteobacteria bacterium]MCB9786821.1 hypothetical protein [Deltaproteobacteria bacterium]
MSAPTRSRREKASMLIAGARQKLLAGEPDERIRDAGLRVLARAERVMGRLEGVAQTLEAAARAEMRLLERMAPIVDDLGELVRHTLDEARERRGLAPRRRGRPADEDRIIDVDID